MSSATCPLCQPVQALWTGPDFFVLAVHDSPFPGYTRIVWRQHIAEMSDLSTTQRHRLMDAVHLVENTQRELLHTDKINLAQFGNQVPHLHWHIIPRWRDDPYFPDSAWSLAPARSASTQEHWQTQEQTLMAGLSEYWRTLQSQLQQHFG